MNSFLVYPIRWEYEISVLRRINRIMRMHVGPFELSFIFSSASIVPLQAKIRVQRALL